MRVNPEFRQCLTHLEERILFRQMRVFISSHQGSVQIAEVIHFDKQILLSQRRSGQSDPVAEIRPVRIDLRVSLVLLPYIQNAVVVSVLHSGTENYCAPVHTSTIGTRWHHRGGRRQSTACGHGRIRLPGRVVPAATARGCRNRILVVYAGKWRKGLVERL